MQTLFTGLPSSIVVTLGITEFGKSLKPSSLVDCSQPNDAVNFHANCAETSVMLALRPDLVQMSRAVDEPDRSAHYFFAYTVDKESVHGSVGNPSQADEAFGQAILAACITELSTQLQQAMIEKTPLEELPPALPDVL